MQNNAYIQGNDILLKNTNLAPAPKINLVGKSHIQQLQV